MGSGQPGAGGAGRRPGGHVAGERAGGTGAREGGVGRGATGEPVGEGWRYGSAEEKNGVQRNGFYSYKN